MLTYFSIVMLGTAARAADLMFDSEARIVMPDHWRLDWSRQRTGSAREPAAERDARMRADRTSKLG